VLIKKAIGIEKGSQEPAKDIIGSISRSQVEEIANIKMPDLNATDLAGARKIIEGTARSMGVSVVD
jgi:large subunit ribosomal protein L11